MAAKSERKPARQGKGNDDIALIGGVLALALVLPKLSGWAQGKVGEMSGGPAGERVAEWMPRVVTILVVLLVMLVVHGIIARVRKKRVGTLGAVVADVLTKSWEPTGGGLLIRWVPFTWKVRKVIVTYPPEFGDRDPASRASVVDAVSYRAGMEAWKSDWKPEKLRVTVTRTKSEVVLEISTFDANRAEQKVRVYTLLAGLFDTDITLNVTDWNESEEFPEGGYPARIEIEYPPTTRDAESLAAAVND